MLYDDVVHQHLVGLVLKLKRGAKDAQKLAVEELGQAPALAPGTLGFTATPRLAGWRPKCRTEVAYFGVWDFHVSEV